MEIGVRMQVCLRFTVRYYIRRSEQWAAAAYIEALSRQSLLSVALSDYVIPLTVHGGGRHRRDSDHGLVNDAIIKESMLWPTSIDSAKTSQAVRPTIIHDVCSGAHTLSYR